MRGKAVHCCPMHRQSQDHPRLCGEKYLRYCTIFHTIGSPPPMRGKAPTAPSAAIPAGITPAYAGKRFQISIRWNLLRDHPRLCGEKCQIAPRRRFHLGSPPPMRGKEVIPGKIAKPYRITPAYAGKSSINVPPPLFTWDHPRLCGEKQAQKWL